MKAEQYKNITKLLQSFDGDQSAYIEKHERELAGMNTRPVDLNAVPREGMDAHSVAIPEDIRKLLSGETFPLSQDKIDHYEKLVEKHYGIDFEAGGKECISMDQNYAETGKTYRLFEGYAPCSSGFYYTLNR